MIRFLPGMLGAVAAYVAAKLAALLDSLPVEIAVFVITYAVATYGIDASMRGYGRRDER